MKALQIPQARIRFTAAGALVLALVGAYPVIAATWEFRIPIHGLKAAASSPEDPGSPGGAQDPRDPPVALAVSDVKPRVVEKHGMAPQVLVTGAGFTPTSVALFGGMAGDCVLLSETQLRCAPPASNTAQITELAVHDTADDRLAVWSQAFQYVDLAVSSLSLTEGTTLGGQQLFIEGTGFMSNLTASLKGQPMDCTVLQGYADKKLECLTPANTAGAGNVVLTNSNGSSTTLPQAFTYVEPIDYATLDPASKNPNVVLVNDNLTAQSNQFQNAKFAVLGTKLKTSGSYYFEVTHDATEMSVGITAPGWNPSVTSYHVGQNDYSYGYLSNGQRMWGNSVASGSHPYSRHQTVGVAVDVTWKTINFRVWNGSKCVDAFFGENSSWSFPGMNNGVRPAFVFVTSTIAPMTKIDVNFGSKPFKCAVPGGYQAGWY